jgi:hypothetical protein
LINKVTSYLSGLTGPGVHLIVPVALSILMGLNPFIAGFCGILPDLVDKPLAFGGIGMGRFIGHTLLFGVVVVLLFFLKNKRYGFSALVGITTHFILDLGYFIPWFYPFKHYTFPYKILDIREYLKMYLSFRELGLEILVGILALGLAIIIRRVISSYLQDRHTNSHISK